MFARFLAALIAVTGLVATPASAGIFGDAPDAILCPFPGTGDLPNALVVFYVEAHGDDGTLLYGSLGVTPLKFFVDAGGKIEEGNIAECHGKTLQQLRDADRAFDFR